MIKVGASKKEILCQAHDVGMLGYGRAGNDVKAVETPLFTRAFVIQKPQGKTIVFVNIEICFPTVALKKAVLQQLEQARPNTYTDSNLMLTAQHTHSAPGGIDHQVFYNTSIPGFQKNVFDSYATSIVAAILEAESNLEPARIRYNKGHFDEKEEVAFNRSILPFNANPEAGKKYTENEAHLAVDRSMKLLYFENEQGELIGSINWFGVHTTSVSNDNTKICSDNKGYAATYTETKLNASNKSKRPIVTVFAQDAAGDVTPNFVWDKKKKWLRGKFEDDFESAQFNGNIQSSKALDILKTAKEQKPLKEDIDCLTLFFDMGDVAINPEYTHGRKNQKTSPACIGMSFFGGTKEGPGVPRPVIRFVDIVISFGKLFEKVVYRATLPPEGKQALDQKFDAQYPKALAMELGLGRIFWVSKMSRVFFVPDFVDPMVKMFRRLGKEGHLNEGPWGPTVLPLQIMLLGPLAIVGIPAEITTVAGERLRKSLLKTLAQKGIEEIILSPYANAYAGYITTFEEYQYQHYEGGHTLFGKWTLAAYQTHFDTLAKNLLKPDSERPKSMAFYQPLLVEEDKLWTGFD